MVADSCVVHHIQQLNCVSTLSGANGGPGDRINGWYNHPGVVIMVSTNYSTGITIST